MLRSTGLVEVPHPKGWVTYGTCWLVDRQRGLALTSQHFEGSNTRWRALGVHLAHGVARLGRQEIGATVPGDEDRGAKDSMPAGGHPADRSAP